MCFLHAYLQSRARDSLPSERLRAALPDVFVSRSSDVLPQIKEYRARLDHGGERLCRARSCSAI